MKNFNICKFMIKNIMILIIGLFSLSTASILIRFCEDVPPVMIATYRMSIASIILIIINSIFIRKDLFSVNKMQVILCSISGLFLAIHFISWNASLKLTSIANSVVLVNTNPIIVGILSYIIFKERHSIYLVFGIILSFSGMFIMVLSNSKEGFSLLQSSGFTGDILALVGSFMASGYLLIGSRLRKHMDTFHYITLVYSISALFLFAFSIITRTPFTGYSNNSYIYMILLAIFPQLIGHTSFNWGLKHISSTKIAITILGEPVGSIIFAYYLFNEKIDLMQGIGIILIFTAITMSYYKKNKGA